MFFPQRPSVSYKKGTQLGWSALKLESNEPTRLSISHSTNIHIHHALIYTHIYSHAHSYQLPHAKIYANTHMNSCMLPLIYACALTYSYMHIHMHSCVHACTHTHLLTFMYTLLCPISSCMHTQSRTHSHVHTYTRMHVHTHTYTLIFTLHVPHIHACVPTQPRTLSLYLCPTHFPMPTTKTSHFYYSVSVSGQGHGLLPAPRQLYANGRGQPSLTSSLAHSNLSETSGAKGAGTATDRATEKTMVLQVMVP